MLDEEVVVLPLADVDAAAAAADHDARAWLAEREPRIDPRFARGDHADQRRARVALRIGAVRLVPHIVALDRRHVVDRDAGHGRGDARRELRRVELGNRPRAAAAAADVLPETVAADAERRYHTDSRNDDSRLTGVAHMCPMLSGNSAVPPNNPSASSTSLTRGASPLGLPDTLSRALARDAGPGL